MFLFGESETQEMKTEKTWFQKNENSKNLFNVPCGTTIL